MTENIKQGIGGLSGTLLSAFGTTLSVNEIQAIIGIIATVIGLLITITTSIIIPVIRKIKKAKADGKITPEETDEILDTLENGIEQIKKPKNK